MWGEGSVHIKWGSLTCFPLICRVPVKGSIYWNTNGSGFGRRYRDCFGFLKSAHNESFQVFFPYPIFLGFSHIMGWESS